MRSTPFVAAALVAVGAATLQAQQATPMSTVTTSLKGVYDITQQFILATANMADAKLLAYQPTEEVRTTGQILAHVANAQYQFCSTAAGEANPNTEDFEQTRTTKEQIVAALEAGFGYCAKVYGAMTDDRAATMVDLFGMNMAASAVLAFNTAHNYEHYGNLVTYLRINGLTPPSSQ